MVVSLEEMKNYLRIDFDDDDLLLKNLITSSEKLCMDVARIDNKDEFMKLESSKMAVMYAVSYQYENRENLDHKALTLSLRSMLFGIRRDKF